MILITLSGEARLELPMDEKDNRTGREILKQKNHMPEDSLLYEKFIPATLVVLAVVTIGMIVFSAAIFLGFIQF